MWSLTFHKGVSCAMSVTPFRADLCKGWGNDPTKLSLALFTVHLHQLTIDLFNPVPLNLLGLGKGSQMTTRKTTRLVRLLSIRFLFYKCVKKSVSGWEEGVKNGKWKVWACGKKCHKQKRETPYFTVISAASWAAPPIPKWWEAIHVLPNPSWQDWPIKTCLGSNQGPSISRLFVDSELSPDTSVLQVKSVHLRQNKRASSNQCPGCWLSMLKPRYNSTI